MISEEALIQQNRDEVMQKRRERIARHMGKAVRVTVKDGGVLRGVLVGFNKDKSLYIMYPSVSSKSGLLEEIEAIEKREDVFCEVKEGLWKIIEVLNPIDRSSSERKPEETLPIDCDDIDKEGLTDLN